MLVEYTPELPYINILEVDNICNHGNEILVALRKRIVVK